MNWERWYYWKNRKPITVILFIAAYLATIPIRDYGSFGINASQGVPFWVHLTFIAIGGVFVILFSKIAEFIVKKYLIGKKHKKKNKRLH